MINEVDIIGFTKESMIRKQLMQPTPEVPQGFYTKPIRSVTHSVNACLGISKFLVMQRKAYISISPFGALWRRARTEGKRPPSRETNHVCRKREPHSFSIANPWTGFGDTWSGARVPLLWDGEEGKGFETMYSAYHLSHRHPGCHKGVGK